MTVQVKRNFRFTAIWWAFWIFYSLRCLLVNLFNIILFWSYIVLGIFSLLWFRLLPKEQRVWKTRISLRHTFLWLLRRNNIKRSSSRVTLIIFIPLFIISFQVPHFTKIIWKPCAAYIILNTWNIDTLIQFLLVLWDFFQNLFGLSLVSIGNRPLR